MCRPWSARLPTARGAAVGVDGVTKEEYGQNLLDNLRELHERLKSEALSSSADPTCPHPEGQRQDAAAGDFGVRGQDRPGRRCAKCCRPVYEQDFLDCSYGFRPGRSAHDADPSRCTGSADQGVVNWILEADIVSFFDSVDRTRAGGDAPGTGGRRVAVAAHRQVLACGRAGRRGVFHAGHRHGPGVGPVAACWATSICTTRSTGGSSGKSSRACKGRLPDPLRR